METSYILCTAAVTKNGKNGNPYYTVQQIYYKEFKRSLLVPYITVLLEYSPLSTDHVRQDI